MNTDWSSVKHFKRHEFGEHADKMSPLLIYSLDALRAFVGRPIRINSAFRPDNDGTHGRGEAVDAVILGWPLLQQYTMVERTRLFAGIGLYPYWNTPGIHMDVRELTPHQHGPRWGRNAAGLYVPLDAKFLNECVGK